MKELQIWIILCLILTAACAPTGSPMPDQNIHPTQALPILEEADLRTQTVPPVSTKRGDTKPTASAVPATQSPTMTPQPTRQPPERAAYRSLESNPIPVACRANLDSAREPTINHAVTLQLGMCWAGDLNPEGSPAHLAQAFYFDGENVTIVMTQDALPDDSIRAKELRVDLAYRAGRWAVVWSGGRWICRAGRGQQDWGPTLCL